MSLFIAAVYLTALTVVEVVMGKHAGKAMTEKGAETLCNLSYALRVVSADIQRKQKDATAKVDEVREWRHRHGVKGRTWKAIVQGLEKIRVVNESYMEGIKKTYGEMEKIMNGTDSALLIMDTSFLSIVRVSYHVVNASESIGQVLRDLVVMFEKTKDEKDSWCCLVKGKEALSDEGCGNGGDGNDQKYKMVGIPENCKTSVTVNTTSEGIMTLLKEHERSQEIEFTTNERPNCWIMGTEKVANGGAGSFIVGATGGFVTYRNGDAVTLRSQNMIPELIKNYTLVRKGYESIKDKYNKLKPNFGPFDEHENQLKELLTQSPMVRRYFKESGKKRKGGEDDDDVIDDEGSSVRKQWAAAGVISLAAVLVL
ncbi:expression site-associated gene (ESAG) protein,putative [Trypanosoma brucei gambiense DAL972]|uniref:Expression site-associated gene 11 (ESAG11) protein, putative n=1 Tax=Trypanosoma brucei gambiense (strain MHOM/CI/86/DAL972) TaxID=679716 RepID=D0AA19_TRYB9|nr:expression site-associated gene (ESAG) protein,putative [Trypanosoma brucei gambiense DAL972]CBH18520.1 expression site-associated gene (ESAG) protein,putative [Trypanosoma brucei gambiense DAL972]|eukprot:XP_011780784.1 expression site-associated gene (ESAG) protein,putative [Trypanosoma brucei gambiense DAL972]